MYLLELFIRSKEETLIIEKGKYSKDGMKASEKISISKEGNPVILEYGESRNILN